MRSFLDQLVGGGEMGERVTMSAVRGDTGEVIAFFNPASETTGRILAERELTAAPFVGREVPVLLARIRGASSRRRGTWPKRHALMLSTRTGPKPNFSRR